MKEFTEKQYLSKREVADLLGLSIYTIDIWVIRKQHIPFVKMGRRVMFDLNDVRSWVNQNKVTPEAS